MEEKSNLIKFGINETNADELFKVFGNFYISLGQISKIEENYFCYRLENLIYFIFIKNINY